MKNLWIIYIDDWCVIYHDCIRFVVLGKVETGDAFAPIGSDAALKYTYTIDSFRVEISSLVTLHNT